MAKRPVPAKPGLTRRQRSRAQREARLQRVILIGTGIIATVVIGLLAYAALNELVIKPSRPVVTVGEQKYSIAEFQDRVKFDYYRFTGGVPLEQTGLDPITLAQQILDGRVDEMVFEQKAAEMGIEVTDAEVEEELQLAFGYDAGAPEPTSTPFPTAEPQNEEPTATPTFVYTLTPSPTPTLEPGVTPSPTSTASPTPAGTLTPTPTRTPQPTAEPMTEEEYNTSYTDYITAMSEATGLSVERLNELWFEVGRAFLLREKLLEQMEFTPETTKTMIHAAHILVETEEEAQAVLDRLEAGEAFEVLAAELSQDSSNAYKGGDLGWFGQGAMVAPFEEAAFALAPGDISEPVQTSFGWHIIKVYDRRDDVSTTSYEQEQQRQQKFQELTAQWRDELGVDLAGDWPQHIPELPTAGL